MSDESKAPPAEEERPKYRVTELNRRVSAEDPKGFLKGIVENIKETRSGVDCSEAKSIW